MQYVSFNELIIIVINDLFQFVILDVCKFNAKTIQISRITN